MDELEHLMKIGLENKPETKDQIEKSSDESTENDGLDSILEINKEQKLLQLADTGNLKAIENLIREESINFKYCDKNGQTALHLAAKSLHSTVCEILVESDASLLKIMDRHGKIPLHLSISSGNLSTKLVEFFLSKDANPRTLTRKRQTSLHIASEKGNSDIIKVLIKKGVPIDDKDSEKFTALHLAAKNGHALCCEDLVKAGADINAKLKNGQTPLHLAAKMRFTSCCSFLLKNGADINMIDNEGNTALHLICSMRNNKGTEECVRCITVLLANNPDLNIVNEQGETVLHAAKRAPVNVLKKFENTNVNVIQTDLNGQTILHTVACRNEITICDPILNICKRQEKDVGKFVNQPDNDKLTALHFAIKSNNAESCKTLIKAGADVNIFCNSYGNALHMVAEFDHEDICDFIISKGANIDAVNSKNKTALQITAYKGNAKICKSLLSKNSDVMLTDSNDNTALHLAAMEGHTQCCQLLVDKNQLTVREVNKDGKTPLHVAVINGMHDCIKVLINRRTEMWKKDNEGHSAVWYAYHQKHDDIFLLLMNSPNLSLKEKDVDFVIILKSAIAEKRSIVCDGLIQSEIWEKGLQTQATSENNNLRDIIQNYPHLAKTILDKCDVKYSNEDNDKSTYNFVYIDDIMPKYKKNEGSRTMGGFLKSLIYGWGNINSSWRANHPVTLMRKKPDLLHHPVITQWMHYKWRGYGRELYYSYICLVIVQLYLLLLYFMKSWTWTTLLNNYGFNQTTVCPDGPRIVGPEVEEKTNEENRVATEVGYALVAFSILMFTSVLYKIIKIPTSILQLKTVLILLTSICNTLLIINFTQCSKNTNLRENIQWLLGYVSSGFYLLILILTFGEHPNCSKMLFDFNAVCQGIAKGLMPLIVVIILSFIYYQFSQIINNVTNMEPQNLWIILISLIFIFVVVVNTCNRKPYIRKGRISIIDHHRYLAFVSLIMEFDILFPPLRNWSYRKEITIDKEYQHCFSLNSMICSSYQHEDDSNEVNFFEERLIKEIRAQIEAISKKSHDDYDANEENDFKEKLMDKISKMETSFMNENSKMKIQLELISQKLYEKN